MSSVIKKLLHREQPSKIEFNQARRLAIHQGESSSPGTDEYIEQNNRVGFVIVDPIATQVLLDNDCLHGLIPVLSPQNSLINADKKQQRLKRIRLENQIKRMKINMPFSKYNADGLELLEGYRMNGHDRITGTNEGFIGRLATQITKVHRFEEGKSKE